ncbi:probable Delta(14)-sterol reductase [Saccharomycodes ludwigii]|uniref:Delta(14)-sterol reductase n=1 Tax=Saccharomycodes ludwigii TaxID=36035 RepID=A0A376B7N8_9ASCO|nr:hypothetical protein SCDLUD_002574 [Saccharomycodes ludwigii]KAH3901098.1 hypothetical protein SCDLUD_002574 [Saccharomycodes ludwigii]SSD60514.1 probable Delta(14)-sterol reductase [Saccharomycodes ludwigii]
MSNTAGSILNPRTSTYEFSGVKGATLITLGLPLLVIILNQLIRPDYYIKGFFENFEFEQLFYNIKPISYYIFHNGRIWCYYILWFVILAILDVILPGYTMYGVALRDGSKLKYNINGVSISIFLIMVVVYRWKLTNGEMPELQFLYNNHIDICLTTILFSFLLSTIVYITSFFPTTKSENNKKGERILAVGGNSGNVIYDWFIGRELNPRLGPLDIKLFCELRPGMLLWLLINLSCLHHYYLQNNGKINDSLLLINVLQGFYIFDGVLNEEGCLTMIDITTDGFGFMLAFGDLALVPFTYSLQARYLSCSPVTLGFVKCSLIIFAMVMGYYIFHSANKQKSDFRQGKLDDMECIQTKRGTKLLCDGWWKTSQHINYLGDWLISLSWCLTTWFQTPLTYYYSLYFGILLLHRQTRDEHKCRNKYGKDWEIYEKKVPYKIIPYVY